ncbi:cytochrome C oxidase subunit IV family protein [Planctomycetales bacterium ZRK34]|nr:cytochrome C oxidase subunit IV family protein [Planctomycetales bacterium ZRK34]
MSHSNEHAEHAAGHDHGEAHQHVVPLSLLSGILVLLLILTGLTVFTARELHFGEWNLVIAMIIACAKGTLVVLYFMHMRWEKMFNAIALITALIFVTLFISVSALDSFQYEDNINNYRAANPTRVPQAIISDAEVRAPELAAETGADHEAAPSTPAAPAKESHESGDGAAAPHAG